MIPEYKKILFRKNKAVHGWPRDTRRENGMKKKKRREYLHGCNFRLERNFSNFRRNISSAPYFP